MSKASDTEYLRLQFLIERDGYRAAREFAIRTLRGYRTMVLDPDKKGVLTRRGMIDSYLVLKDFYFRTKPYTHIS